MRMQLDRSLKERLALRLTYNPLLRLLLFKFWFRMAFLGLAAMVLFLALFLPKIWRTSAPGVLPVIKISGLDLAQAWSLKRTARREMEAGRTDRAHYAWYSAVANNPADPEALRGLLSNLLRNPAVEPGSIRAALGQSFWLLHITKTNAADRALVAELLAQNQLHDSLVSLLRPFVGSMNATEETAYLKALFWQNRMAEFGAHSSNAASRLPDPELPLYQAAYAAGWGVIGERDAARQKLDAALDDPAHRVLANKLQLFLSSNTVDLARFEASFERLRSWGEDTLADHASFWRLLSMNNRKAEAKQFAMAYSKPLQSGRELAMMIQVCAALNLPEKARQSFRAFASATELSDELWLAYADFLASEKDWDELRSLAAQMRATARISMGLKAFSYFLEGRAELERGRSAPAETAFAQMNQLWEGHPQLALSVSSTLLRLGYHKQALELLAKHEEHLQRSPEYWQALLNIASQTKDPELLLKSASRNHELQPDNISALNNYAAALLVNRLQPDLAIRMTIQLIAAFPNSAAARINHAFALLFNERASEARAILSGIKAANLVPQEVASFHLASFQVYHALGQYEEASQMLERIDPKELFPNQVSWIEECRKTMPRGEARAH
jgi:hypothetical protein